MTQSTIPLERGKTWFGGTPTTLTDKPSVVGQEYNIVDTIHSTGRTVVLRLVKNTSGIAVLPKRLALLNADGTEIIGYTRLPNEKGFPIDEVLPAVGGCADDDVCYVVISGPALVLTSIADYAADVDANAAVNSLTAVTSGATTAGRIGPLLLVAGTADATASSRNLTNETGRFGMMITQALTDATNADKLVDVIARPGFTSP